MALSSSPDYLREVMKSSMKQLRISLNCLMKTQKKQNNKQEKFTMKVTKSRIVSFIGAIGLLAAGGCSDANVELVKNGCFDNYKEATIGTILQERFDDCKWTSTKESGRTIVTFTGKISKATHDLAMNDITEELVEIAACLLYTSDAADEEDSGDLGGGRISKKKKLEKQR
eukprot:TRINITY_DN16866_c0_g1_i1.p2 TRINITY_DN16866_c0_g1~~TRINITY_DN16866_c0_g1_i1.p2  ORF type:complete len:171 (-),score=32.14 TRINITY_DN16866_c0_g1_i1:22-534(-)